jgi:curved DNA-binding protein CbpA
VKPLAEQNLYEILEVSSDAAEADIVKAWDRVSALCAPGALATYTLMAQDDAALLGRRLEEALTVLLDPVARQRYDESLSLTPAPRGGECQQASASGPEETPHPRVLPPVIRPRPMPPIIPPLREIPAPETVVPAPIPLERVAPAAEAAAPAESEVGAPIALATPAPVSPPFAAKTPLPASLAAVAVPAPAPRTQGLIVGDGTRYTGDVLRQAREARGITLQQLCERTKITRHHVENLEADRYERLPAAVYLRGILMALAKELRLDGQKVARSYLEAMAAAAPAPAQPARATQR